MSLNAPKTVKVNLPLRKKSDKILNSIVDEGLRYVVNWAHAELTDLQQSSKLPIVVPLSNGGYKVATYLVEKLAQTVWRVGDKEFADKRSAIFYCALKHRCMIKEADAMYAIDQRVSKFDIDKTIFRSRLDAAHEKRDNFRIDLLQSRFDESKRNLAAAKKDLEKIITTAKYIQVNS